jgi:hypothetical protein
MAAKVSQGMRGRAVPGWPHHGYLAGAEGTHGMTACLSTSADATTVATATSQVSTTMEQSSAGGRSDAHVEANEQRSAEGRGPCPCSVLSAPDGRHKPRVGRAAGGVAVRVEDSFPDHRIGGDRWRVA